MSKSRIAVLPAASLLPLYCPVVDHSKAEGKTSMTMALARLLCFLIPTDMAFVHLSLISNDPERYSKPKADTI